MSQRLRLRRASIAAGLGLLLTVGPVFGQGFRPFVGWDAKDPCLRELVDAGVPDEIATSDALAFQETLSIIRDWLESSVEENTKFLDELNAGIEDPNLDPAGTIALTQQFIDCLPRIRRLLDEIERRLDELGVNTLTVGRARGPRPGVFTDLRDKVAELGRGYRDILARMRPHEAGGRRRSTR
ncbi:MAG: hypothetical protein MJB57_00860 [Gemmatimonadetes bacterium]|nr:hypothetical protein [Gemmatimonadota bacterium]